MNNQNQVPESGLIVKKIAETLPLSHQGSVFYALGGIISDDPVETQFRTTALLKELGKDISKNPFGQEHIREGVEL